LEKFKKIDGFMASGVLSHNGELIMELSTECVNIAELGSLTSDMLRKAQTVAEITGFGRSQLVYFETEKAHIFSRCLNESNTKSATPSSSLAHVHMVMVVDKEGSVPMAKMHLENIIKEVDEHFR
jgi:predicted regulator of Ras-like GTPase activity (Roadblock/LC7/MglB family)